MWPLPVLIVLFASLGAFAPASVALALPAMPLIVHDLGGGPGFGETSLAAFFAMLALGMLVYGPLSDAWGRKPVLLAGLAGYVLASLGCVAADGAGQFLAARAVQALGGGAAIVLARAIVQDMFPPHQKARLISMMVPVAALVPMLAPLAGQWLVGMHGWRSVFLVQAGFGILCLGAVAAILAESLPVDRRQPARPLLVLAAYGMVMRDRVAAGHILTGSAIYAGMMAYVGGSPAIYMGHHGLDPAAYGRLFALGVVVLAVAALVNGRLVPHRGIHALLTGGVRGALASALAVAVAAALDLGGVAGLAAALLAYLACCGFVGANALTSTLDRFRTHAGTASALFGTIQFALGGLTNLAVGFLADGSALPMGAVMAAAAMAAVAGDTWARTHRRRPQV